MKQTTIRKSIDVNAPKEIVWEVLLDDKFTRIWYAEFSEGSHAETDWKIGSKAVFTDNSGCGLIATVVANKPYEFLQLQYTGYMNSGIEDYHSKIAQEVKGGLETYRLSEKDGVTNLSIECSMSEQMFETMSLAWNKALLKLQELSESQTVVHS
jgi:hypothetical protein